MGHKYAFVVFLMKWTKRKASLLRGLALQEQGDTFRVAQKECKTRNMSLSRVNKSSDL